MEAAVAALEAAAEKTAGAASSAKEAAVAASAAATEAAGAATAAKEAAMAALATAEQAAAASSAAKEAAVAAEAAAKESAAAAAATARELAAAMRCSKKRRFHQIDDGGSPSGNRDDRGNLDLISALPDDVLGSIISRLPTEDGARTQVISRRWLPLWRSAPLNLVVDFSGSVSKLIAFVSKILSEHLGPARRLSLNLGMPYRADVPLCGREHKVEDWLRSQALNNLQELNLTDIRDMPLSVFRFAPTLCVARLIHCDLPKSISTLRLNFPCLKQLTLHGIYIMQDALHNLLSGCTALESLELTSIFGIGAICISSQTLRSLAFSPDVLSSILQLVIKDAPSLERLLPLYPQWAPVIQVIHAPKLEVLGLLSQYLSKVQFGTTIFEVAAPFVHRSLVLVLHSIGPNLDAVVDFLKCFPCLVRLYVISQPTNDMNNAREYDPLDPIECLELHLKKVVLMNYNGSKRPSVEFAKFFVLNSKLLKEMEIEVLNKRNDKWMANQRKQLCVDNRASQDARIELKISTKKSDVPKMDTHDLSVADPFESGAFC
ncbi:F-box/FBD/LRR-repeat protein At3g26920-like isoform X2 [Lolium perenne]|uniref:F-box/FBD/LRR-repeat protein At3g26920-like isoform X2 n=1 Tax=Lolium perenne TaxID=4522 RepID=UPI0021F65FAA|nr:F-box/FBD/LRR-repeat protein At3g26920-like isoform X2 [Lolium perenne]